MQHTIFFSLLALAPLASVAENTVDYDDVPGNCVSVCASTVDLSQRCDQQTNGDNDYRRCYCGNTDAQKKMNECASCVKANDKDNDNGMSTRPSWLRSRRAPVPRRIDRMTIPFETILTQSCACRCF